MNLAEVDLAEVTAHLGHALRSAGVDVTAERCGRLASCLHLVTPATLEELYWVGRVTLVADREQIPMWDRVFGQVFRGLVDVAEFRGQAGAPRAAPVSRPVRTAVPSETRAGSARLGGAAPSPAGAPGEARGEAVMVTASDVERLGARDFSALSGEELLWLRAAIRDLAVRVPPRRARRRVASVRGDRTDLRSTLRRAQRTGGDPVRLERRRRRDRPRKLILLCDISGSMESYARAYLQLLIGAVGGARAEAFVFATRLTRLTRALRSGNPDVALERAGRMAPDWSGGTRIGGALKAFNDRYGRPGMARGAVVVIISDGWDVGDPALLEEEIRRLRRLAWRLVWVNPRRADPGFRPLTAGMAAALPYVDAFVSGHSLHAMSEVLTAIAAK